MYTFRHLHESVSGLIAPAILTMVVAIFTLASEDSVLAQGSVIRHITQSNEHLELTVNSSRILTLEKSIPRMVVNNPELVSVTAISKNQIQVAARNTGVTQINLWDEDDNVYTVDISIYGDVRELQLALKRIFPKSSVKVIRLTNSLVLEGFVEKPEAVGPIIRLAEDYAPKIINNITVGGVQQVMLKVKIMEVSRTKLRGLGFDFAQVSGSNFFTSSISGLLSSISVTEGVATGSGGTMSFGVVNGSNSFFGFINALQQNNLAKILADPTIIAISGRPAHFNVGGEIPYLVPAGLGQVSIEFKPYGTQVDFLPIVLGNGNIRLEVRPRISEIDDTRGVTLGDNIVPAFNVREVDTAVEMKAGQTLALAGLVQTRVEAQHRGIPYISDLPYLGAAFRRVDERINEIELLILVTPELVDGMDPHEVPPCGPGMESMSPSDCQLYFNGQIEIPSCGPCGPQGQCVNGSGCNTCQQRPRGASIMATDEFIPIPVIPSPVDSGFEAGSDLQDQQENNAPLPAGKSPDIDLPATSSSGPIIPSSPLTSRPRDLSTTSSNALAILPDTQAKVELANRENIPDYRKNPTNPIHLKQPQLQDAYRNLPQSTTQTPGLIGPIGYDVEK
jgi:pilus assembly protein CpaC